jgi:ribulose-phosphate 3-epimerase
MTIKIIPTVLASTLEDFNARLRRLLPAADEIQVDIMDGKFVPSRSITINEVPDVKKNKAHTFEAHLMVQTPGAHIQPMARRGFRRVIFHIEAVDEKTIPALLEQCRKYKVQPMIAINPETPITRLLPYVNELYGVVFLGVHPGFNGAPFVKDTAKRIKDFAKKNTNKKLIIQVDGGMTPETIGAVVDAGATRINSGSFVSNAPDPKTAIKALYSAAQKKVGR